MLAFVCQSAGPYPQNCLREISLANSELQGGLTGCRTDNGPGRGVIVKWPREAITQHGAQRSLPDPASRHFIPLPDIPAPRNRSA